jgi:hypothetical protein
MKVIQVAESAFFVPSYSEQTIMRSYTLDATVQSFCQEDRAGEYDSRESRFSKRGTGRDARGA